MIRAPLSPYRLRWTVLLLVFSVLVVACNAPAVAPSPVPPTLPFPSLTPSSSVPAERGGLGGLSTEQVATLSSLEQVDEYPLYTMHYHGGYAETLSSAEAVAWARGATAPNPDRTPSPPAAPWACSLFAALADTDGLLYGRNFDWEYSPALLLHTEPPDGYASVSMVDIAYFGFDGEKAHALTDLPLTERQSLLSAPLWPFDGMNEQGLVVGMAAVPSGNMRPDPDKETIGSLGIIREMLDHAANVDEAVAILQSYNVDMEGGPPLHYLVSDRSGRAVLLEFYRGKAVIIPNEGPWHQATNFLRASVGGSGAGHCRRYDHIHEALSIAGGRLDRKEACLLYTSDAADDL